MSVISHTNAAGDVSIGVTVDDVFVPALTISAAKVAQLVERGQTLQTRAAEGDERSLAALGSAFKVAAAKRGKATPEDEA